MARLLFLFPVLFAAFASAEDVPKRPHIVLMMADDQGWGDAGYQGHPFVQTPHLDAMAKESHVFDRFYAAAPVCSPTRASVFTGRSPLRTRVLAWGHYLHPKEETLAQVLRDHGYVTGMFGKFHIGSGQPASPCNPGAMGFDEWCIGLNFFDNDPYLSRNGVVEKRQGKGTALLMDDALAFLDKHHEGDKPMFVVAWFPSPHYPHEEVPDDPDMYEGKEHAPLYREVTLLDEQVGRMRAHLRKLGIEQNTIVWYCSDNGGLLHETAGGREKKGSIYEGGLRVPALIEWPAKSLGGRSVVPTTTSDIFPTLTALAGIEWTPKHPIDGQDLRAVIEGQAKQREGAVGFWKSPIKGISTRNDMILEELHKKQQAGAPTPHLPERITAGLYEMPDWPVDQSKGHAAWLDWPWKLHRINGDRYELYDLRADPQEAKDLSADPAQAERLEKMKTELSAWMVSVTASYNGKDYAE
ncbi:MAG: sulfatase-like hydrolase/transferase [Akkermansiaceae bacterium]|nr:sulfatase-like hydrolase/transferase [Akkermansiaceae bacterium]